MYTRETNLFHGDWAHHKYIRKYKSKKSGKYVYVYDGKSDDDIPDAYKPDMKPSSMGSRKGYVYNGIFYEGDYKTARKKAYEFDLKANQAKVEKALEDYRSNSTLRGKVGQAVEDIANSIESIPEATSEVVSKGRNFIANILESAADKIRE